MTDYPTRRAFETAIVQDHVDAWNVADLAYVRANDGTAIVSSNGVRGMPSGQIGYFAHWGVGEVPGRDDASRMQAALEWARVGGRTLRSRGERVTCRQALILDDPVDMILELAEMQIDWFIPNSGDDNGLTFNRPVGCKIIGPARLSGNATGDIVTDHMVAIVDPIRTVCAYLDVFDYHGFGILFYHNQYAEDVLVENFIAYCSCDGGPWGSGGAGMAGLTRSRILHPYVANLGEANPGYAINLKNRCHDTHVVGGYVENCPSAVVFSSDRASAPGEGCFDCTAVGALAVECGIGLSFNKTTRSSGDVTIRGATDIGVLVAGFNTDLEWRAVLRDQDPDSVGIMSRSHDWTGWLDWDGRGSMWLNQDHRRQTVTVTAAPDWADLGIRGDNGTNRVIDARPNSREGLNGQ